MAYNFDEYFRRFLKLFKQILKSNTDHPLKHIFKEEDIDRLVENPPSQEDIAKFMKYFFGDPNANPFSPNSPFFSNFASFSPIGAPPPGKKPPQKVRPDTNLIVDSFEFGNEVHVLVGTNRTDLEFKTGVKKRDPTNIALIIRDKKGAIIQVVKLPPTINQKTKQVTYQNGTYEIIYMKKN
ncbi:MAG: hypothetical protein HWN66_06595 [Candidatus Helarchaeota archaeon]|nr:hypothetical protein [Candidatus Helarchaeota archaeon]